MASTNNQDKHGSESVAQVIIGSCNPVKIASIEGAFGRMFPKRVFTFHGVSVRSGVPEQPFGDEQTLRGAVHRLSAARRLRPDADYWVGLEGGVGPAEKEESLMAFAWIVVQSRSGSGRSRTASFPLPPAIVHRLRGGMELGHASDEVFQRTNTKHTVGAVGLLTDNTVDRVALYEQAAIMALVPLRHPHLYG